MFPPPPPLCSCFVCLYGALPVSRSSSEQTHERELERIKVLLQEQHGQQLAQVKQEKLDLDRKLNAAQTENKVTIGPFPSKLS